MRSNLIRKLKTLALICIFTVFAGVFYQLLNEEGIDYNSIVLGFSLGLVFGLLELFLFPMADKRFRQWSFTKILLFKTLLYTAIIFMVAVTGGIIAGLSEGRTWADVPAFLTSRGLWILVLYTLVIYSLMVFFLQINSLLGQGVLWKFIRGKYYKPREEERIFMFLDMKSSTAIAEQLGHARFYALLNELFYEISEPVLQTKAEIYQYVGDEVVLTWELTDGLEHSNCLKTFFIFRDNLFNHREYYLKNFGIYPQFKAGMHCGKVISAQIGDLKREIVYNGDVMNTTSRIQNECNHYQRDFLVSGALMDRLQQTNGFQWERLDSVSLRGKEMKVELFSVTDDNLGSRFSIR